MIEMVHVPMQQLRPRIVVIGVGGAGGNAVANMIRHELPGVEFAVVNTDAQALNSSPAFSILQLGRVLTEGLGAGSRAQVGRAAAEESLDEINRLLDGAHMCFIAAGMGGGTGTGAAPVIARAARQRGILTVGVVTKPFAFEGKRRAIAADQGVEALKAEVDTLIVIPNQNLFRVTTPSTTFKAAFDMADEVLEQGVRSITDLMVLPGLINLDFADVRTVMAGMGTSMLGVGEAGGEDRALRAAQAAVCNPLLDEPIDGARGVIISIAGGDDMRLMEIEEAAAHIKDLVDPDAEIIWGSTSDPSLGDRMRVSVVATGLETARAANMPVQDPETRLRGLLFSAEAADPAPAPEPVEAPELMLIEALPEPTTELPDIIPVLDAPPQAELPFTSAKGEMPAASPMASAAPPQSRSAQRGASLFERMVTIGRTQDRMPPSALPQIAAERPIERRPRIIAR